MQVHKLYFVHEYKLNYDEAFLLIWNKWKYAKPSETFKLQLKHYDVWLKTQTNRSIKVLPKISDPEACTHSLSNFKPKINESSFAFD